MRIILVVLLAMAVLAQPTLNKFITDEAEVLSAQEEAQLAALIEQIEKETTVEIAVYTVSSLQDTTIELLAVEIFEKSGIGKKDKDNGLLIVLAPNEREYRLEVGYGLEGAIPDAVAMQIGTKDMVPSFQKGEFGQGLIHGVQTIGKIVAGDEEIRSQYTMQKKTKLKGGNLVWLVLMIVMLASRGGRGFMFLPFYMGGFGGGMGRNMGGFGGFGGGMSGGGGFSGRF